MRWNGERTWGDGTHRYFLAVELIGDSRLLEYWPDKTGAELDPVDAETVAEIGGMDRIRTGTVQEASRYSQALELWQIGADHEPTIDHPATFSLYTYVDLTLAEEGEVKDGSLDLHVLVDQRRDMIAPIVAAIEGQIRTFLATELPAQLLDAAAGKREQLTNRQAVRDSLTFPGNWRAVEPKLEDDPPGTSDPDPQVSPPPADTVADGAHELQLDPRSRLSPATFNDVMFSLRHWANAVERYPSSFSPLKEEPLSDLPAATFNATLPGAGREVYTRSGKSDIFIQANALDPGRGPATVFICEAKFATDHAAIHDALDPQLFSYLNVHDTAAILLVLMRQKDFASARTTYQQVIEGMDGHQSTRPGPVEGWPLMDFAREGRTVTVCAAFVHLPPP